MKLINFVSLRLSVITAVVLAFWSVLFYFAIMDEINDEVDDSLEDFAEVIILRSLAGEPLPEEPTGSNNQYYLREVTPEYAAANSHIRYEDREVYIKEKKETEPARVVSYIFTDDDGRYMEVEVSVPTIDKSDLKEAIFRWMITLYAVMILAIVLINVHTVRRSMRPLKRLLAWIAGYRLGGDNTPLDNPSKITEFRQLNEAISQLTERNETSYEQQKLFIGNASHEMQTPLAVCQSRLEMLLEDDTLTEQQMGEIVKTLGTINALARLNRSLLMLCKIENGQYTDTCDVNLTKIARDTAGELSLIYASKNITVSADRSENSDFCCTLSASLASVLVTNLVKNAFVHTAEGGNISISSAADSLTIANTAGTPPLDVEKIFQRFYHSHGVKSSTGLGLPIVRAVCNRYALAIAYRYDDTEGMHVFRVKRQDT